MLKICECWELETRCNVAAPPRRFAAALPRRFWRANGMKLIALFAASPY